MIELYEGRIGGGKTYNAVVSIVSDLIAGRVVCTNVELKWEAVKQYILDTRNLVVEDDQLIKLRDDQIGLFHRFTPSGTTESPVRVYIDEAHLTFNARDFAKTDKLYRETLTFLTQSRKVHTDVIFIAQSILNMDKQFMRLVQYIWRFRDLSKWKVPGLGINYPFQTMLCVQYDYDGVTALQRNYRRKDPRIFALYNTNSLLREFPRLDGPKTERKLKKQERKGKLRMKYALPIIFICAIIGGVLLFKRIGTDYNPAAKATSTTEATSERNVTLPTDAKERESAANKEAYRIYEEGFVSWDALDKALQTSGGWYTLGQMSGKGLVVAVSSRTAKVSMPDTRTGYIVANKDRERPSESAAITAIAPTATVETQTIVGLDKPQIRSTPEETQTPTPNATPTFIYTRQGRRTPNTTTNPR